MARKNTDDSAQVHEAVLVTTQIIVKRQKVYHRFGRFAWNWVYACEGPDGTQFDNSSIVTLRSVLRRRYGQSVMVVEPWKPAPGARAVSLR